jgi:replicative DNA helicase
VRLPQHDIAAERAIVASVLLDECALAEVRATVNAADFYDAKCRLIIEAAFDLYDAGQPAEIATVFKWLIDRQKHTVSSAELLELVEGTPAVARVEVYAQRVSTLSAVRRMASLFGALNAEGMAPMPDPAAWLNSSAERVFQEMVSRSSRTDYLATACDVAAEVGALLTAPADSVDRLSTGLRDLDKQIGGLRFGGVHLVAARPGVGKSALAMQIAVSVARAKHGVAVFSLEMAKADLVSRSVSWISSVPHNLIDKRQVPRDEQANVSKALKLFSTLPMALDDNPVQTLGSIRASIKRSESKLGQPIRLVVIDYVQLLRGTQRKGASRAEMLGEISHGLLALAKDLNVAVLACAQLNRNSESRFTKDKQPQLSDLRESGDLEQDARTVIMLYREDMSQPRGTVDLLVRKCRQGGCPGTVMAMWDGPTMSFADVDMRSDAEREYDDIGSDIGGGFE